MTKFFLHLAQRRYEDPNAPEARSACGKMAGLVGIGCNLLLFLAKLLVGLLAGSVCRKKAVMLWRYTLASGSYCGSADGRSISLQENADWRNPRLAISLDEIHAPPLRPLRRSAVDLASQCHSFSQMRIWWN